MGKKHFSVLVGVYKKIACHTSLNPYKTLELENAAKAFGQLRSISLSKSD
jgi:hypothetical protein